jgi:hypothetical protein
LEEISHMVKNGYPTAQKMPEELTMNRVVVGFM